MPTSKCQIISTRVKHLEDVRPETLAFLVHASIQAIRIEHTTLCRTQGNGSSELVVIFRMWLGACLQRMHPENFVVTVCPGPHLFRNYASSNGRMQGQRTIYYFQADAHMQKVTVQTGAGTHITNINPSIRLQTSVTMHLQAI